jgi:dihydrofolate reductase/thymidylate synthase
MAASPSSSSSVVVVTSTQTSTSSLTATPFGALTTTELALMMVNAGAPIVQLLKPVSIIVAATRTGGIGNENNLPWPRLMEDMKFFRKMTTKVTRSATMNAVIMGRKTWESIPVSYRPLNGRANIVITSTPESISQKNGIVLTAPSLAEALEIAQMDDYVANIFIIGGGSVYRQAMSSIKECRKIYLTQVLKEFKCDTHFTIDPKLFTLSNVGDVIMDNNIPIQFLTYERNNIIEPESKIEMDIKTDVKTESKMSTKNVEEQQYLNMIRDLIDNGDKMIDRTGVGTKSKFGACVRYSLRNGRLPLLTTKRVFWRAVVDELEWIINGKTDAKLLQAKGVRIWDGNGTKAFLTKIGQGHREEFDLGPIYGHQWRFFGAPYVDCHTDYKGQGVDQVQEVVNLIKTDPNSRRMLVSAWNPKDLKQMALPPCHVLYQFYVANGELSCVMYQRSADMGLGVPFNIASYALLTHVMASVCGLVPGELIHMMGSIHVYNNHIEPLREQITREPYEFPTLRLKRRITDITEWTFDDFEVQNYKCHPPIKMEMAI